MTNQRVVMGVSLVGTTLAALIALYWFWNRKDEKKTESRSSQVAKTTASSVERRVPASTRNHSNDVSAAKLSNEVSSLKSNNEVSSLRNGTGIPLNTSALSPEPSPEGAGIGNDLRLTSDNTSRSASCLENAIAKVNIAHETTVRHRSVGQSQSEKLPFSKHHDDTSLASVDGRVPEIKNSGVEISPAAISKFDPQTVAREATLTKAEPLRDFDDAGVSRNRNVCLHGDSDCKSKTASSSGEVSAAIGHDLQPVSENIEVKHISAVSSGINSSLPLTENVSECIKTEIETEPLSSKQLTVVSQDYQSVTSAGNLVPVLLEEETTMHLSADIIVNQLQTDLENANVNDSDIIADFMSQNDTESKQGTEVIEKLESESQDILSRSSLLDSNTNIEHHIETSPATGSSNENSLSRSNYKLANNNKIHDLQNTQKVNSDISATECRLQDSIEKKTNDSVQSCESVVKAVQVETEECSVKGNNSGVDHQKFVDSDSPVLLANKSDTVSRTADKDCEIISAESTGKTLTVSEKNGDSSKSVDHVTEIVTPSDSREEFHDREPSQSLSRDSLEPLDNDTLVEKSSNTVPEKAETTVMPPVVNGDNTSEASNDSGKGASVAEAVTSHQPLEMTVCQVDFPSDLCGRLIGRNGKNINYIKERTATSITLRDNPYTDAYQLCCIEGYPSDIEEALAMIRERFPKARYPNLQLEFAEPAQESPVLLPDLQMTLPPGVSVDVIVSSVATGGLLFLQQPTHPTFPSLERLNQYMMACYSQDQGTPQLPRPVEAGVICAGPIMGGWYRAMVVELLGEECDIKFVDYGGYCRLPVNDLRQIRSDFMTLPFQAVECYMGNLTPVQGEVNFGSECTTVLGELTEGKLLQAQVVGRATDGVPFVHIYQVSGNKVLFVNREMVNRGVAQWIEQL